MSGHLVVDRGGEHPRSVDTLAGETERGWDDKARLPERLARYAKAKERGLAMRDFIVRCVVPKSAGTRRASRELQQCGSYLVFRHYLDSGRVRLHAFRSCRQHLICPFCAIRRGARMLQRYLERVELVMASDASLSAYMVTLTVRDGEDLRERYQHLHRSLKRLHHRRHLDGESELRKVVGAVWSYEFKRGSGSGLWHPHVHAVYLSSNVIDGARLAAEWRDITGDSFIVDVHELYGERADAFSEVFKYAVKFANLPVADNWHGYQVLKSRRLVASCGVLWGVEVPEQLSDDPIELEQYVELAFLFMRGVGYVRDRTTGVVVASGRGAEREEVCDGVGMGG